MSNFGTMVERVAREVNRTTTDLGDEIRLAIIDAIEFHDDEADFFNESEHQFYSTDGQAVYVRQNIIVDATGDVIIDSEGNFLGDEGDLPYDMTGEIIGGYLHFHVGGDLNNSYEILLDTYHEVDRRRFEVGDTTSYPNYASWSPEGLRFVPPIQGSDHLITFRYKQEMFRPGYSWNGSSFSFTSDDFTSPWFSKLQAERLIRLKAILSLYETYIDDESMQARAERIHERELTKYRSKDTKQRYTGRIQPGGLY